MTKKVLFTANTQGHIFRFHRPYLKLFKDLGYKVHVAAKDNITERGDKIYEVDRAFNVPFDRFPYKLCNIDAYFQLKKIIKENNYDIIHCHTPVVGFLTRFACRNISNVKTLYTAHGFHFFKGSSWKNRIIHYNMEKIAARWTDGLITMNSEDYLSARKMRLRKNNSVYKVHGVGVDLSKILPQTNDKKRDLRREYNFNEDDFILVYAAELSYRKHQDLLINAISLLKNRIPNIKLLFAGAGSLLDKYKQQVRGLGLYDNIQFLGFRKDIVNLMMLSDIAVSSSRQEGLPVNVLEAMATGLPLIVTDCRGNVDLVCNGENGYVVGTDDVREFANSIEKLYKSEELRNMFGRNNLELIKLYSIDNVMKEMQEIYKEWVV